jgi:hypothetical protein
MQTGDLSETGLSEDVSALDQGARPHHLQALIETTQINNTTPTAKKTSIDKVQESFSSEGLDEGPGVDVDTMHS